ncbi:MAG TPA: hypothetical protein VKS44_08580 [Candidatus Acidoferrales bacterium]|nr:hypothetical protein [Candidatus Acidoferrales bacterium]
MLAEPARTALLQTSLADLPRRLSGFHRPVLGRGESFAGRKRGGDRSRCASPRISSFSRVPHPNPVDWWAFHLAWRISRMEFCDPFGWHTVDKETLENIRSKLAEFEKRTLNEIFVASRKQNHGVPIKGLCSEAQKRLDELRLPDVEQLYCLRLSGTQRVWGFLTQNVLNLIWWDKDHLVCPSEKKYT